VRPAIWAALAEQVPWRRAEPLPGPRRTAIPPAPRPEVHLHFHGVDADDVADALPARQP
jgi:hypothetical protein